MPLLYSSNENTLDTSFLLIIGIQVITICIFVGTYVSPFALGLSSNIGGAATPPGTTLGGNLSELDRLFVAVGERVVVGPAVEM